MKWEYFLFGFVLIIVISSTLPEPNPYTKNEQIIYKDISHISNLGNDITYYNIYTKYNKFQVSLTDFNELNIKDNITVCYDNNSFIPYFYCNQNMYFSK